VLISLVIVAAVSVGHACVHFCSCDCS
jgi:hypothetical protein